MDIRKKIKPCSRTARVMEMLQDEKILYASGIHWKNYILPAALLVLAAVLALVKASKGPDLPVVNAWTGLLSNGTLLATGSTAKIISAMEWLFLALVTALSIRQIMRCRCVGYYVTNKRAIKEWGWPERHSVEIQLNRCKAVGVNQTLTARIFDTGSVILSTPETTASLKDIPDYRHFAMTVQQTVSKIQIEDKGQLL